MKFAQGSVVPTPVLLVPPLMLPAVDAFTRVPTALPDTRLKALPELSAAVLRTTKFPDDSQRRPISFSTRMFPSMRLSPLVQRIPAELDCELLASAMQSRMVQSLVTRNPFKVFELARQAVAMEPRPRSKPSELLERAV